MSLTGKPIIVGTGGKQRRAIFISTGYVAPLPNHILP